MSKDEELASLRAARIGHLESLIADLDHDWVRVPKLAWLALLSPVVAYFFGPALAVVEVVVVGCLIGVVYYILGMRREEYRRDRDDIQHDLDAATKARGHA